MSSYLPAGPYTLVFSILYNYSRSVPTAYTYKVFGVQFSSKSLTYILSLLLVFAVPPNSIVSAACGVLAGMMYRANVLGSRQWRVPKWVRKLSTRFLAPSLASTSIPRRSTRTALRPDRTEAAPRPRGPLTPGPTRQGAISEVMQTLYAVCLSGRRIANCHVVLRQERTRHLPQKRWLSCGPCFPMLRQNRSTVPYSAEATTSADP